MKKLLITLVSCTFLTSAVLVALALAADAPSADITLDYLPSKTVIFKHAPHTETVGLKCEACHHQLVDGKIAKCSSAGCHDSFDKKDKSEKSFYKIVHDKKTELTSCLTCHKDYAKDNKVDKETKKALTGCSKSKCHP